MSRKIEGDGYKDGGYTLYKRAKQGGAYESKPEPEMEPLDAALERILNPDLTEVVLYNRKKNN